MNLQLRPAFTAHGEHLVTNSDFQVLEIELNKDYIQTGILNFRGMAGDKSTAGLFVDEIKVVDIAGYQPPDEPSDPGSSIRDPDPGGQDPDEPTLISQRTHLLSADDAYFGLVVGQLKMAEQPAVKGALKIRYCLSIMAAIL